MAVFSNVVSVGWITAGADLSSSQFFAVKLNSSGAWVLCSAQGERAQGIVNEPAASGIAVGVTISGVEKAVAGAAFDAGDFLTVTAAGRLEEAASGDHIVAQALETASALGQIVTVLVGYQGIVP